MPAAVISSLPYEPVGGGSVRIPLETSKAYHQHACLYGYPTIQLSIVMHCFCPHGFLETVFPSPFVCIQLICQFVSQSINSLPLDPLGIVVALYSLTENI